MFRTETQALPTAHRTSVDDAAPETDYDALDGFPLWQLCGAVAVAILALASATVLLL